MLNQALLLGIFCIIGANCYYGDGNTFADPSPAYSSWNWRLPDLFGSESRKILSDERDVEDVTEKDGEPISPDSIEIITKTKKNENPRGPGVGGPPSYDSTILPGGVIDVDADSFGFPELPSTFGFSSTFGNRPGNGLFGLGGFFGPAAEPKPWWKGENVCIEREETTDDEDDTVEAKADTEADRVQNFFSTSISLSNCQQTPTKYECVTKINNHGVVKTFTVRYKCCYGFKRVDDTTGCSKKIILAPLLPTIEDVGAKEYVNLVHSNGVEDIFKTENLTIFAPIDLALNKFSDQITELNQVSAERRRRQVKNPVSSKDLVLNHILLGFIELSELINEEVIYSYNNQNNQIRINTYPTRNYEKMLTANCARVSKSDNFATNGIVHVIDGVLNPITQSITNIIDEHPQLSNLRKALQSTDLTKHFKHNGHYTIFAPTDEAFNKLEPSTREKILRGDACASTILKHHIVAHTVCSVAIIGNATTHNVDGELLNLQRTEEDVLTFETTAKIVKTDLVATNGVIHLIDVVIIPETALYVGQALKNDNFTKFQDLIEKSGLTEEMDSLTNLTIFAPSDTAFEDSKTVKMLDEIKDDKDKLKELVLYHTVQGKYESCNMNNNVLLKSKNNDKSLRLNLYSTVPIFTNVINRATINCARLTGYDEKTCGSVIHEVNQVLIPPSSNLLEALSADESYSTFVKLIKDTDLETVLKDSTESLTVLAPTNDAFEGLDSVELQKLTDTKEKTTMLVKKHILTEIMCCSGIGPQTWGFNSLAPTLSHQQQSYGRSGSDIHFGNALVKDCDNVATNGVIHKINKVLLPQQSRSPGFEFFLFNL